MHNDQAQTYVGEWWLDSDTSRVWTGTLKLGATIELEFAERKPDMALRRHEELDFSVIHGRADSSDITLLGGFETGYHDGNTVTHRLVQSGTVLLVSGRLSGVQPPAHFTAKTAVFNRAAFRLTHLDHWVNRKSFRVDGDASIHVIQHEPLTATIPGGRLTVGRDLRTTHGRLTHAGFASHEIVEIEIDTALPLDDLDTLYIRPLEQMLTLATQSYAHAFDLRVAFEDPSNQPCLPWQLATAAVVYPAGPRVDDMIRQHMRFGMNDSHYPPNVEFTTFVQHWFELHAATSQACDGIFNLYRAQGGYLEQHLLTLISALEALHRSLNPQLEEPTEEWTAGRKEVLALLKKHLPDHRVWVADATRFAFRTTFKKRLHSLVDEVGHMTSVVGDTTKWIKQLVDSRDAQAHLLELIVTLTTVEKVALLRSAQLFAELVLLCELGFTEADRQVMLRRTRDDSGVQTAVRGGFPQWFS